MEEGVGEGDEEREALEDFWDVLEREEGEREDWELVDDEEEEEEEKEVGGDEFLVRGEKIS